ncbi:MAG: hypothetical protein JSS75_02240 [Bacteroidetes bacterium]|nr:hypothetical protein [Bacteroidota bacterium]
MRYGLYAVLFFSLLYLGCSNPQESGTGRQHLINLTPGNHWTYRIEARDPFSGRMFSQINQITVLAYPDSLSSDLWDTVIQSNPSNSIPDFFPQMSDREDGTWVRWSAGEGQYHLFKSPATINESWKLDSTYTGPDQYLNKCTMIGTTVLTVGSTTYTCNIYQYLMAGGHYGQLRTIYIAPGYSIIKGVYISDSSTGLDTTTYTLQP